MNTFNKSILISLGLLAFLAVMLLFLISKVGVRAGFEISKIEDRMGTRVIIDHDTMMITDYSLLRQTYTMSDGREFSHVLVEKAEVVR